MNHLIIHTLCTHFLTSRQLACYQTIMTAINLPPHPSSSVVDFDDHLVEPISLLFPYLVIEFTTKPQEVAISPTKSLKNKKKPPSPDYSVPLSPQRKASTCQVIVIESCSDQVYVAANLHQASINMPPQRSGLFVILSHSHVLTSCRMRPTQPRRIHTTKSIPTTILASLTNVKKYTASIPLSSPIDPHISMSATVCSVSSTMERRVGLKKLAQS